MSAPANELDLNAFAPVNGQAVTLSKNYFVLMQMPTQFGLDRVALDAHYRQLQMIVHPDKFVNASDAQQRQSVQWSAIANQAYQTLKSPLSRAKYLCGLNGIELGEHDNTAMAPAFLMQQMQWRESLDQARDQNDPDILDQLLDEVLVFSVNCLKGLALQLDEKKDFVAAASLVRELMFIEKLTLDIEAAQSKLG
jgi:molecular chaperone HscB